MKPQNRYRFKKIDAFAANGSSGNPAGAVYLDHPDDITPEAMLQIAKELKGFVSEVGFVWPTGEGAFGLRYYSSEREVAFCGHATVAILYDLIASTPGLLAKSRITIYTKNDTLTVENRIAEEDAVFITAPSPKYRNDVPGRNAIAQALAIAKDAIDTTYETAVVNAGLETLIVPVNGLDAILNITPDLETLNRFCHDSGIDIVILFTPEVSDSQNRCRTRVFAATFGYLEDPATGSGNSALGYYLLARNLWDGGPIRIEQNGERSAYNIVKLTAREGRVMFGGGATVKIEGTYSIQTKGVT